jgi:hypothetical protein
VRVTFPSLLTGQSISSPIFSPPVHFRSESRLSLSSWQLSAERSPPSRVHVTHPTKMRRYKIDACILLITSVFSLALAAPVPVQRVREACTDAVDRGDNVIIELGKRGAEGDPSVASAHQKSSLSSQDLFWSVWGPGPSPQSSSAPNYGSGTRPNPSFSSGESKPPLLSSPGGTELSWISEGEAIQPGSSTETQTLPPRPPQKTQALLPQHPQRTDGGARLETIPEDEVWDPKTKANFNFKNFFKNVFSKLSKLKLWRRMSGIDGVAAEG